MIYLDDKRLEALSVLHRNSVPVLPEELIDRYLIINHVRNNLNKVFEFMLENDKSLNTRLEWNIEVFKYRFGLVDGIEKTLVETGKKFGRDKERIRQIEVKMLRKLRHSDYCKSLRELGE